MAAGERAKPSFSAAAEARARSAPTAGRAAALARLSRISRFWAPAVAALLPWGAQPAAADNSGQIRALESVGGEGGKQAMAFMVDLMKNRQLGATLGTGIFLSLLFGRLGDYVKERFTAAVQTPNYQAALADPANASTVATLKQLSGEGGTGGFNDTSWLATANHVLVKPILDGFTDSMVLVAGVGASIMIAGIVFAVFVPNLELKHRAEAPAPAGH